MTAPLVVMEPAEAVTDILPLVVVVIPVIVTVPVAAVNEKLIPVSAILRSVLAAPLVMEYVVIPIPSPTTKFMTWVVFTLAVTVRLPRLAEASALSNLTELFERAFMVRLLLRPV